MTCNRPCMLLTGTLLAFQLAFGCTRPANDDALQPDDPGNSRPQARPGGGSPQEAIEEPRDPLAEWPRPLLAIVLSGRQYGYLEPCGCTGLDHQKGGMARKHELIRQLAEDRGWSLLPVDLGNQVRRFGRQSEIKFQLTIDGLRRVGYRAMALGPDDLRLPAGELVASISEETEGGGGYVSANVSVIDPELMPRFRLVELAGKRLGFTSVLAKSRQARVLSEDVTIEPVVDALASVERQLAEAECDQRILLVQGSLEETRALANRFPSFSIVLTTGGAGDPPEEMEQATRDEPAIVQVGPKGMFMGVLGLYDDPKQPWRYARMELDSRYPDSEDVLQQLRLYQQELERAGLEGLGVRPAAHPAGSTFVGSQACAGCHSREYEIWAATPHARATDSLIQPDERGTISRHHDPECLSCHVTGWHPAQYFPFDGGYLSLQETPGLKGNGCENCHGPGSRHVAAESAAIESTEPERDSLRELMQLKWEVAEAKCLECHDLDNSPDFHEKGALRKYWEQIKH